MAETLILGAATGYQPKHIEFFVRSVVRLGLASSVHLLINEGDSEASSYLASHGIQFTGIRREPRWLPASIKRRLHNRGRMRHLHGVAAALGRLRIGSPKWSRWMQWQLARHLHHISCARYWHYLTILEGLERRPSHVLVTDVRDVVFQSDPFLGLPDECLLLFQEDGNFQLGTDASNIYWIRAAYGNEMAASLGKHPILCSGTTLGSFDSVLQYVRDVVDELGRLTPRIVGQLGFDQGVHNVLYRTNKWPGATVMENFKSPVVTLGLTDSEQFVFDGEGRLLNSDCSVVPVLHQYDRHGSLLEHCRRLLGGAVQEPL